MGVNLLVSHSMGPGVNHANRCQMGVNVLQGRIEQPGHCAIAIGILVDAVVERFIVTGLEYVFSEIHRGDCYPYPEEVIILPDEDALNAPDT